ncbi:flagellar motor protein MotB [Roseivirga sp. 4D4]|uniref:OmpA/MotB family protein n=1 Tax=Roseivirga sp. 4D4 TaxID=1889784 RepID=UPI00147EB95C|nr:OmpA family protein [Roseivirga sp. 4D4]
MSAQNDIERLKNDSLQLIQAAEVSIEEIEKLNKEKLYYKAQLEAKEAELAQSNMTLNAATQKLVATQQQLNEIAKDLEVFNTDFRIVTVEDGHVKLSMDEAILFKQGSTYINGMGDRFLKELAPIFKRADVEIAVAGHTDPIPVVGQDNNWDLSVDRSIAVIEKLTNDYGVSPEKLMAAGKSKYDPIVPNEKASDMAKNRRVEFIIIPNLEALASAIED